jgi:hypothetical protein
MESSAMFVIQGMPPALADVSATRVAAKFTLKLTPFDQRQYRKLIAARAETIQRGSAKAQPMKRTSLIFVGNSLYCLLRK